MASETADGHWRGRRCAATRREAEATTASHGSRPQCATSALLALSTPLPRDHNETLAPRPMLAQTLMFTALLAAGPHRNHRSRQTANRYWQSGTARLAGRHLC